MEEELQRPTLSREQILFWFEQFREGDVSSPAYQRQIIDNFVNSVYVFEDRVVLNFNFTIRISIVPLREVLGSSADGNGPPKQKPEAAGPGFLFCAGIAEAYPVRVLYCCASEALPAAEAAELEQGQRSEYSSALHARRKFRAPQPDPPNKAYPNPVLYEEGFGYVFSLPEVLRRVYTDG